MDRFFKIRDESNPIEKRFLNSKRKQRLIKFFRALSLFVFQMALISLIVLYFVSPLSKLKTIEVEGNYYLTKNKIIELSQLDQSDIYDFIIPKAVEKSILRNGLIKSVDVKKIGNKNINIKIVEKKIYAYLTVEDVYYWLCEDGLVKIETSELGFISEHPYLVKFEDATLQEEMVNALKLVDPIVLKMVSSIYLDPISYDDKRLRLVMIDGNNIYVSMKNLNLIDNYEDICTVLAAKNTCIYFDVNNNNAYTKPCEFN